VVNKSLKEGKDKQLLNDEGSQTSDRVSLIIIIIIIIKLLQASKLGLWR